MFKGLEEKSDADRVAIMTSAPATNKIGHTAGCSYHSTLYE